MPTEQPGAPASRHQGEPRASAGSPQALSNWAGNVDYDASGLTVVRSLDELRSILSDGRPVRALGTRHSFNRLADTPGELVSVLDIDPEPELDGDILTIGAGARYAVAAEFLEEHGRALPNMGSLPHISVGGAISTGTHGSGVRNANLAAAVVAVTLVGAGGEVTTIGEGEEDFHGAVVALGRLGVVTRVSIRTVPSYLIRQDVYTGLPWDVLLEDPAAVLGAAFSVSVFTTWATPTVEQVWVKRRRESVDEDVPDEIFGARRNDDEAARVISEAGDNTTPFGVALPWLRTLPHFRIDRTPSSGDEIQSEYFVAIQDAADALRAVRALSAQFADVLIMSEIRTVAADSMWLSPAFGRDSVALHFTWRNAPEKVLPVVALIERALEPLRPRPHWGKLFQLTPDQIAPLYPQMERMRQLVRRRDPRGQFSGPFVDELLGLHGGPASPVRV